MAEGRKGTAELGRPTAPAVAFALFFVVVFGAAYGMVYGSANFWVGQFKTRTAKGLGAMTLINALVLVGAILAISRTGRAAARLSKFRSMAFARVLGAAGGLTCIYMAWAAFASWSGPEPAGRFSPLDVWHAIHGQIREIGTPFIPFVYATEVAALLFLTSRGAREFMTENPFCGVCGRWLTLQKGMFSIGYGNVHRLLAELRKGNLEVLAQALAPDQNDQVRLDVATCDQCDSDGVLTAVRVKTQVDERGQLHHWETPLAQNIPVTRDALNRASGNG